MIDELPGTDKLPEPGKSPPDLSVVSPVFNAEGCVAELCDRLQGVLESLGVEYEILLVDDNSEDGSWSAIQRQAELKPCVKGFRLSRNVGQQKTITAGLSLASGQWTVVMDCDLQDPPEAIPTLWETAQQGHEIVLTHWLNREVSVLSRLGGALFHRMLSLLTGDAYDPTIGVFSIVSRKVVDAFLRFSEQHRYYIGVIRLLGFQPKTVQIERQGRFSGKSSYSFRRQLVLAVDGIVSRSARPLYVSVFIGAAFSLAAVGLLIHVLYLKFWGISDVPGWTSLIAVVLLVGGMLSSLLGVIGIYLAKIFVEVKRRPLFIIRETTGDTQRSSLVSRELE